MTHDEARCYYRYNPDTGVFRWNDGATYKAKIGKITGCKNAAGYIRLVVKYKLYYAHRVAWLIMTGAWPKHQIDHIDGDKSNNKWKNLREATGSQNQYNRKLGKNNLSGIKGVYYNKRLHRWQAQIGKTGGTHYLGTFKSKEKAKQAYQSAAKKTHGEFVRLD